MRTRRFEWEEAHSTAREMRRWHLEAAETVAGIEIEAIRNEVKEGGDEAVLALTARFGGGSGSAPSSLVVDRESANAALSGLDPGLRESLEVAAENIWNIADAQRDTGPRRVTLPQGQTVTVGSVPVGAAGI